MKLSERGDFWELDLQSTKISRVRQYTIDMFFAHSSQQQIAVSDHTQPHYFWVEELDRKLCGS